MLRQTKKLAKSDNIVSAFNIAPLTVRNLAAILLGKFFFRRRKLAAILLKSIKIASNLESNCNVNAPLHRIQGWPNYVELHNRLISSFKIKPPTNQVKIRHFPHVDPQFDCLQIRWDLIRVIFVDHRSS